MSRFKQFDEMRIVRLLRPPADYDGWRMNQRAPAVGETGTLLDVLQATGLPDHYLLENSGPDGRTIWLAELLEEEIEPVASAAPEEL